MAIGQHAILITVAIIFMLPIVLMFLTALMTDQQSLSTTI